MPESGDPPTQAPETLPAARSGGGVAGPDGAVRRERLRGIIDLVPHMIFARDRAGIYLLANRAVAEAYGTTVDELIGRDFRTVHPVPAEARRMLAQDRRVIESGEPLTLPEERFTDADGRVRCLQVTKVPFVDAGTMEWAVLGVSVDITEQKEAARLLREKDELIQTAFDHAPVAIVTFDMEGTILSGNRKACQILEYSPEELPGVFVGALTGGADSEHVREVLRRARNGEVDEFVEDRRYVRKDGTTVHGRMHVSVVHDADGRPLMMVAQFDDQTERRRAEREAERLRENLAHVARVGAMGEMTAGIAHEMNQPLTAISSYAQACRFMLERGSLDEERLGEVLDKISKSTQRAGEVIRRLRTFVRKRKSERIEARVDELVADVVALMEVDARLQDLEIHVEPADGLPPVVADKVQIQQVVLNLVRNAMDAMRGVEPPARPIVVRTEALGEAAVVVAVEDRGPGVPEDVRDELFHPFVTTKETGMGMGLSICRSIVDAHGGRLWFTDNPEGGATFYFSLPTADGAAADREGEVEA